MLHAYSAHVNPADCAGRRPVQPAPRHTCTKRAAAPVPAPPRCSPRRARTLSLRNLAESSTSLRSTSALISSAANCLPALGHSIFTLPLPSVLSCARAQTFSSRTMRKLTALVCAHNSRFAPVKLTREQATQPKRKQVMLAKAVKSYTACGDQPPRTPRALPGVRYSGRAAGETPRTDPQLLPDTCPERGPPAGARRTLYGTCFISSPTSFILRPMKRFTDANVFSGLTTPWRLAICRPARRA